MPQMTFPVADDRHIYRVGGTYPPGGLYTPDNPAQTLYTERAFGGGSYSVGNALLRFNTSSLPDDAVITSATLQVESAGRTNADSRSYIAEFYQWFYDGSGASWSATAPSASLAINTPLSTLPISGIANIALSDPSGISKTGSTYLRTHVSGGQPTGSNHFYIYALDDTVHQEPRLIVNYTIGNVPIADFDITGSGFSRTFADTSTDVGGSIVARSWTFGDGDTSTAANPHHTYASTGTYTVALTVTDTDGNTATTSRSVTINQSPVAGFSVSGTGLTRNFTDTSTTPVGSITARLWAFGDGATSTATNPSYTYTAAGTYTITLVVTNSAGEADDAQTTLFIAPSGTGKAEWSKVLSSRQTTLTAPMDLTQTIASLAEVAYWPDEGTILVDQEQITYSAKNAPNGAGDLTGMVRGANGTTAASHASGAEVKLLGRHDAAISAQYKIPTFPVNAALSLQEIRRFSDWGRFAWADLNNLNETAELTIEASPTSSGNVTTTLDENGVVTARNAAVTATKEVRSLTINAAPTASGNLTVTLSDSSTTIPIITGLAEKHQHVLSGSTGGYGTGSMAIEYYDAGNAWHLDGVQFQGGDTAATLAARIRAASFSGWTLSGTGPTVTATATTTGARGALGRGRSGGFYVDGPNGVSITETVLAEGSTGLATTTEVATAIRNTAFPGWVVGGTGATVTFTALEPGARAGTFSYSAGATGATSTSGITQTTAGAQSTPAQVATAVRALYSGNAYWNVGGTNNVVSWVATSTGAKLDAGFSPGTTGTKASIVTLNQGSKDVVGHVIDSNGVGQFRRLLANIATTTLFNFETTVSGASTDKGIVSFWGSFATDPKTLLWRVERLDLTDYPAGELAYGVTGESSTGLTWDVLVDEALPTDRGQTYYRDHNALGELIGQAYYYGLLAPEQAQQDLFVQDLRQPVLPGEEIALAFYMRFENLPASVPPQPVYLTCHKASGEVVEIGSATPTLSGDAAWLEYVPTPFVVPADCYELRLNSRDMSQGTVVIQEACDSSGAIAKRTRYYALDGSFRAQLDMRMPFPSAYLQIERERTVLETVYEANSGIVVPQYRSASDPASFDATWYTDASEVPDLPVIDAEVALSGGGVSTPEVPAGYPRLEYRARPHKRHLFLKGDRTELPGGVIMNKVADWYRKPGTGSVLLPSGHTRRQKLHDPVGFLPSFELWAFRPQTVQYLLENLNRAGVLFYAEVFNELLLLKVLIEPEFARATLSRYDKEDLGLAPATERYALWVSNELSAEVLEATKIPE